MAFGIHKPGQGYWVRALTAAVAGAFTLWFGLWVWQQAETIRLPDRGWNIAVSQVKGTLDVGELVGFETEGQGGISTPIGTAVIQDFDQANGRLRVGDLNFAEGNPTQATRLVVQNAGGATGPVESAIVQGAQGIPVFPQIYLQLGGFSIVVLIGAIIIFSLVGSKRSSAEFLIATDGEMKKVNWGTRKDVIGSTWVVVAASFLIALFLFVVDLGFSRLFRLIGVLEI